MGTLDVLKKYEIPFLGLKEGEHELEFHVEREFFESFETSEVRKGTVEIKVLLEKSIRHMVLNFTISGNVEVMCDRCLGDFSLPIDFNAKLFVKFGEENDEVTDDVIFLNEKEHTIKIAQYIFESIHLGLPYKRIHPDDENGESTCNLMMLRKLEELSVQNSNQEKHDSRWDQLKNLTNSKNLN